VTWLPRERGPWPCVVEVRRRGVLYVTTRELWARGQGVADEEAESALGDLEASVRPPAIPAVLRCEAKRKGGAGNPLYTIQLPDVAIWALLKQGTGPLAPQGSRHSAEVLVSSDDAGSYIRSHEAFGLLAFDTLPDRGAG